MKQLFYFFKNALSLLFLITCITNISIAQNVNMSNGSSTACGVNFFDSGGSGSNYTNSQDFTYTFYPTLATQKVQVNFSSFGLESCCDYLRIYNGKIV